MKSDHPTNPQNKNSRLGRGLSALLGPAQVENQSLLIDIEKIEPNKSQPRKSFNKESLAKLSASIKEQGLLQPILVQKKGEGYQIIAGERRWRSACMAGLRKIPVIVKTPDNKQKSLWTLVENIQREDLNPIEEAKAFKQIMSQKGMSQEALSEKIGRSRSSVANSLRLLSLDKEVQRLVEEAKLSFAQAREILRFKNPKEQRDMAQLCLKKSLTVKKLSRKAEGKSSDPPFWAKKALSRLERLWPQKVRLNLSQKGKGQLSFYFKNSDELKDLLNRLWNS